VLELSVRSDLILMQYFNADRVNFVSLLRELATTEKT